MSTLVITEKNIIIYANVMMLMMKMNMFFLFVDYDEGFL